MNLFADRDYAWYALGVAVSGLGTWAQRIGIGWLSWELSHSVTWVGLVSLALFLPLVLFAPLFGGLLDRCDPRRYTIAANGALLALSALLYLFAGSPALRIEGLFAFALLIGIGNSAYQPARLALVNHVAPPGRLAEAIAINSIIYNVTRSVGPALAGLAIAAYGIAVTFAMNALSFLPIMVALLFIEMRPGARTSDESFLRSFIDGVRYARGHAYIRTLMLLSLVTALLGRGVVELLPAFAGGLYDRGSAGLAALTTAGGLGAIVGGALLARASSAAWLPRLVKNGTLWTGAVVLALGATASYGFALVAVAILGLHLVLCGVGLQVLLQQAMDDAYRGRVLGLWGMVTIAGPGIGSALLGAVAQYLGLRATTLASGALCAVLVLWILRRNRDLSATSP